MLDEGRFGALADETLSAILAALEERLADDAEVDLQDGILTIELADGGRYVVNKHAPNRQIWVSSPVSGAAHFDWQGEQGWVGTRGEGRLADLLERELSAATGVAVTLAPA